jgi:hypothetical protein
MLLELGVFVVKKNPDDIFFVSYILKKLSVGFKVVVSLDVTWDFIEEALTKFQKKI